MVDTHQVAKFRPHALDFVGYAPDQADEVQALDRAASRHVLLAEADSCLRRAPERPGAAGEGSQRRVHPLWAGGDYLRPLLRAAARGLHLSPAPRPRIVPDEGGRAARDDGPDVR